MDIRSLSSSQSDLILLISTESVECPCPPPPSSPQTSEINPHFDICDSHEANTFGSEIVLKHMEARKRSKRMQNQRVSMGRNKLPQNIESHGEDRSVSLHKVSNDSSSQNKGFIGQKSTFDTSRTDKTGRSSIGSWIKKKMMRIKGSSNKKSDPKRKEATNKIPGHVHAESFGTADRDEVSLFGSMSLSDVHKNFGSRDNSIEVFENESRTIIDDFSAATFSELLDEPRPLRFDFRDKLELYKGRSASMNKRDVQDKVERLNKEASFMLLSFSVAPSDSGSDEDTTDDNFAEAIAKEIGLRRLIMGEPEPPGINIKEVTIPCKKSRSNDVLSPRVNTSSQVRAASSQVGKPTTPMEKIAGFFFGNNENMDSPGVRCGITEEDFGGDATISP